MSSINQFFPSAGGLQSPTPVTSTPDFPVRVQITEGGGGASYFLKCSWCTAAPAPCSNFYISGKGGGVADLNLVLDPGTTCSITVGAGGSSYVVPMGITNDPNFIYPPACNCLVGSMGEFGGPSKFENYGFYPNGSTTDTATAAIPTGTPYTYSYPICNFPSFCVPCLIECGVDASIQNLPNNSFGGAINSYSEQTKGLRLFCLSDGSSCEWNKSSAVTTGCEVELLWSVPLITINSCRFCSGGIPGGGADNRTQTCKWSGGLSQPVSPPISCPGLCFSLAATPTGGAFRVDCGGYTSYITGAVCAYGVGGARGSEVICRPSPGGTTATINECVCLGNELCYHPHAQYRFPGSGGGASTVACAVLKDPTVPCSVICDGCPGSVIVQYPTCFGAAVSTGSSVIDCSPNTPGFRTYKFMCPGTIQFP